MPSPTGHARHGFCLRAAFRYLIRAGLIDQQLDQGTGIAEQDHQLTRDLPARFHSRVFPDHAGSQVEAISAFGRSS
ncbi:MAG: hypothetical protein RLZZ89_1650 [Cyanobacteriota bacterium]